MRAPRAAEGLELVRDIVVVTGGAGYIGSVLVRQLLRAGHAVRVLDAMRVGGEALLPLADDEALTIQRGDVRHEGAVRRVLEGADAVVHLAAIVGDPACKREPELAREVNLLASQRLFDLAEAAGVKRFVFASTCSNYGKMADPDAVMDETSELRPVSLYAETKVAVEAYLAERGRTSRCAPTSLRFATVHGVSPRMRFDLTVNEFTRDLVTGHELVVFGERFWRPYCHVADLARAAALVLAAPREAVACEVFNVGDDAENFRKQDVVDAILRQVPGGVVRYVERQEDPRDYRVSFRKIRERLGFEVTKRLPDGIAEVKRAIELGLVPDPYAQRYANVPVTPPAPALRAAP